jgi:azurin
MTAQFQAFSRLIQLGEEIPVAAEGMRGLARANWTHTDAGPLAQALVAWAKKTPEASRRGAGYLGVAQLAEELSGKLPAAEATALRKELLGLRSASFLVRAVPEEMRFDVPRLVAEVGKAFTIVFENPDAMPHNLVVVKPGTREKVGQAALELRADFVDRLGRAFVPETSDVIAATKLLDPGQSATIRVDAPLSEGEYEYVCTFPGHWVTMWGKLIITSNPDAVLAAPAAPAAPGAASGGHQHGTR